jgi:hypothetical protein
MQFQMSLSKKLTYKGALRQMFCLSEAPSPPLTPYSPPPYTLYTVRARTLYSILYLFTQGRGGGGLTRDKVRGATVHKAGRKYQRD